MINLARRHPLVAYFVLVYIGSAAALVAISYQLIGSFAVFPMLVGSVALIGVGMTAATGGRKALRQLAGRLSPRRIPLKMWAALLIAPAGVLVTLGVFTIVAGPTFRPGWQLFGLPIGLVAGFLEETGWTGFAYPRLAARFGGVAGAVLLGFAWGVWHLPVIDSLGAASPHGAALPAFFLSFVVLVAAIRCLICWAYTKTGSLLLAQLIHASFTGTLVLLSAPHVTAWQEVAWYAGYAALAWVAVLTAYAVSRRRLPQRFELGVRELEVERGHVLLQMRDRQRTRDRQHHR